MRTYHEQTELILKKVEQYHSKKRKQFKNIAALSVFALIITTAYLLDVQSKKQESEQINTDVQNEVSISYRDIETDNTIREKQDQENQAEIQLETTTAPKQPEITLFFNDYNEISSSNANANIYFGDLPKKEYSLDEAIELLGFDVRPNNVPEDLISYFDIYPDAKFTAYYNQDSTVVYEQFSFPYEQDFNNTVYNPLERSLQILASKQNIIAEDTIAEAENMTKSFINGHDIIAGKRTLGYGPFTTAENGSATPTGFYTVLYAQFTLNRLHFQVIADNLSEEEFTGILASIIEKQDTAQE